MTEPTPASKELFDKLKEIERELSDDSVKLLKAIVNIARGTIEAGKSTALDNMFTEDFEDAFTPYPQSTVEMIMAYQTLAAEMIIVNTPPTRWASPPMVVHVGP